MDIQQNLNDSLKDAMRAKDELKKTTIRMVLSGLKLAQVEKGIAPDEAAVIALIQKEIKIRAEAIAEAQKIGRADLAEKAQAEADYLETFLPAQLSAEELLDLVRAAVQEVDAKAPTDMGKVMKVLMPRVAGRAAGDQVSLAVRRVLQP